VIIFYTNKIFLQLKNQEKYHFLKDKLLLLISNATQIYETRNQKLY